MNNIDSLKKAHLDQSNFNRNHPMAFDLSIKAIQRSMEDVYDFFYDVNRSLLEKNLQRLEDMMRPANLSGMLSDMLTDAVANNSAGRLTPNLYHNGHPDLLVKDYYPNNAVKAGEHGIEVKSTRKRGGAVDSHGARAQTLLTFVYDIDNDPAKGKLDREPLKFTEVYLATVTEADYRKNNRGELGTRTATLDRDGIKRYRESWVYLDQATTETGRIHKAQAWRQSPA